MQNRSKGFDTGHLWTMYWHHTSWSQREHSGPGGVHLTISFSAALETSAVAIKQKEQHRDQGRRKKSVDDCLCRKSSARHRTRTRLTHSARWQDTSHVHKNQPHFYVQAAIKWDTKLQKLFSLQTIIKQNLIQNFIQMCKTCMLKTTAENNETDLNNRDKFTNLRLNIKI